MKLYWEVINNVAYLSVSIGVTGWCAGAIFEEDDHFLDHCGNRYEDIQSAINAIEGKLK
ncbi:MAG TPA: hypothetical protein V6C58_13565 [Allocoleopsis sp.]